jgi:hypothetical protein
VSTYLLSEAFFDPIQAFRLVDYVCHRTGRLNAAGRTSILVHLDIVYHSVHIQALTQKEATAIQVMLAGKPVKILAAYISPSRPLICVELSTCFCSVLPVLLVGDLNAKHV